MRAIRYHRVSSAGQARDDSISSQKPITSQIAKSKGYEIVDEIDDDGISGTLLSSRKLNELLSKIEEGTTKIDVIVVSDSDRIFREDTRFTPTGIEEKDNERKEHIKQSMADVARIRSVLITNEIMIADKNGIHNPNDLVFEIQRSITTNELNKLRDRVDAGKFDKLGKTFGSKAPFGYKAIRNEKRKTIGYEVDEVSSKYVIRLFELVAMVGCKKAAEKLNEEKIPTPFSYAQYSMKKSNGIWSRMSVQQMVRYLEKYKTGKFEHVYKGKRITLSLPPIIDESLYVSVVKASWKRIPKNNWRFYSFTGLIKCQCGSAVTVTRGKYINCRDCRKNTKREILEPFIWKCTVVRLLQIVFANKKVEGTTVNSYDEKIKRLTRELAENQESQNRLAMAVANGLSIEAMVVANVPLLEAKQKLEAELSKTKKDKANSEQENKQAESLISVASEQLRNCIKAVTDVEKRNYIQSILIGKGSRIIIAWDDVGLTLGFPPIGNLDWTWFTLGDDVVAVAFGDGQPSEKSIELSEGLEYLLKLDDSC